MYIFDVVDQLTQVDHLLSLNEHLFIMKIVLLSLILLHLYQMSLTVDPPDKTIGLGYSKVRLSKLSMMSQPIACLGFIDMIYVFLVG